MPAHPVQKASVPERGALVPDADIDHADDGILIADTRGQVTAINGAFARRTGYGARDVLGKPLRTLELAAAPASAYGALREALARSGCWRGELMIRRKNGETAREQVSVSVARDCGGQPTHYIAVFSDCANEFRKRLSFAAHHDELTGLPNRKHFFERLALGIEQAARHGRRLGVLFLDLDHFKAINDTLGFEAGDALLGQVAARLRTLASGEDLLARVGDDEFTLLVEADPDAAALAHAAARIVRDLTPPFSAQEATLVLSGSVGISRYPEDGRDPHELLRNAELAMFEAKGHGRNRHAFYSRRLQSGLRERFLLTNDLRGVLEGDALVLHYHPIMDVAAGTMSGVEALARWKHPVFGLVPPERFISLAEDAGLIAALGTRVLAGACRQLKAFDASGMAGLRMAVNLSALQVRQPDVVALVRRAIEEAAVDPARIEIEITESAIIQDTEDSLAVLRALKALGVGIAIDDFGMGYSSLGYLRRFPADR
ncbi:MAG: diguanylate cyclase, partial [Betaproteobacteria bacterium]|nr:diguanylate cyclase [Betaproteobacteria bacterium]